MWNKVKLRKMPAHDVDSWRAGQADSGGLGSEILAHIPGGDLRGCDPMLRKQKRLYNVRAENVLRFIYDLIKPWGNLGKVTRPEYIYLPYPIEPPKDNRIEVRISLVRKNDNSQIKVDELREPMNNLSAVVFEVWQLQEDTVLLQMRYLEIGLPVNVMWSNILANFSKADEDHSISETRIANLYNDDNMRKVRELSLKKLTITDIAIQTGVSVSTVKRYRKNQGIRRRKP